MKNISCEGGEYLMDILFVPVIGGRYRIKIADSRAVTPPSLFGIERRMAYSHKKYHSG